MIPIRLSAAVILLCAAMTGCYMNIKGVEDNSRLTSIEQRLCAVEQAVGIPSPPPVQIQQSSDAGSKIRIKQADYTETEDTASPPDKCAPRTSRRSSPAQYSD
ncbi:MAG: hypothetical protein HY290_14825 [Planctomycetia bacterium]|nr:hypothetical protein [Planctomycetia bacterium]